MKHPIIPPPNACGVYAIKNEKTGATYVGKSANLRQRMSAWRGVFSGTREARSKLIPFAVMDTDPEDWVFIVLHKCQVEELSHLEERAIAYVKQTNPSGCLNTNSGRVLLPSGAHPSMAPKTEVFNEQGEPMTRAQIATRCGVKPQAIKKRLQKLRAEGVTNLNITDLLK